MDYENPWLLNENIFTSEMISDHIGFVYKITNLDSGRFYIGKKLFTRAGRKQVKGKKKRIKVESDWLDYYGSNKDLLNHVNILGKDSFKREILFLCKTKGEASYYEAKEQFARDALISEQYYNEWIMVRVRKSHVKKT